MTAYLIVRAEVADPDLRSGFDAWYEREHLRDAAEGLEALRGWRAWSRLQPAVHYAFYRGWFRRFAAVNDWIYSAAVGAAAALVLAFMTTETKAFIYFQF